MDLKTMGYKVQNGKYKTLQEMRDDCELMSKNALIFNRAPGEVCRSCTDTERCLFGGGCCRGVGRCVGGWAGGWVDRWMGSEWVGGGCVGGWLHGRVGNWAVRCVFIWGGWQDVLFRTRPNRLYERQRTN